MLYRLRRFVLTQLVFCGLFFYNYSETEKNIKVIITSYNNENFCIKNLKTLLTQKYTNYEVFYCNDASTDNTLKLVKNFVNNNGFKNNCKIIENGVRCGKMANIYKIIIDSCKDEDIIMIYDGDDWLAHDKVLSRINEEYLNITTWATYGSYEDSKNIYNPIMHCAPQDQQIIKSGLYRKGPGYNHCRNTPGHPFTFYAWLFKKINEIDFKYQNNFVMAAPDGAILWPIIEMCGFHLKFIPDLLLIYNNNNELSESKVCNKLQSTIIDYLTKKNPYSNLDPYYDTEARFYDVFIITDELNLKLDYLLNSVVKFRKINREIGQIFIYHNSKEIQMFKKKYPSCSFL